MMDIETILTMAQITMSLLCIMLALTLWMLMKEMTKVKEAIAIICAADSELTKKITTMLKLKGGDEDGSE